MFSLAALAMACTTAWATAKLLVKPRTLAAEWKLAESQRLRAMAQRRWAQEDGTNGAEPGDDSDVPLPLWLKAAAKGAGVDLAKVWAGDVQELAKVQALLPRLMGQRQGQEQQDVIA